MARPVLLKIRQTLVGDGLILWIEILRCGIIVNQFFSTAIGCSSISAAERQPNDKGHASS